MNRCRPEMYDSFSSDLVANPVKDKMIGHREIQNSMKQLQTCGADTSTLTLVVRPHIKISDTARLLLKTEEIEISRDPAGPLNGYYLIDRKTYKKYE